MEQEEKSQRREVWTRVTLVLHDNLGDLQEQAPGLLFRQSQRDVMSCCLPGEKKLNTTLIALCNYQITRRLYLVITVEHVPCAQTMLHPLHAVQRRLS